MSEPCKENEPCCGCCHEAPAPAKKKSFWRHGIGLAIFIILVLLLLTYFSLGNIIKQSIQTVGSTVTKCNVSVKSVALQPIRGRLIIDDLVIGNPEGYKTESAFKLGRVLVKLQTSSLLSDKIIIDDVQIVGPAVTYELGLGESNLGKLQKNVEASMPSKDDSKPAEEKKESDDSKPGKKIQINHFIFKDGQIGFSATLAQGKQASIPLPPIELNDIGKDKEVSTIEATATLLTETLKGAISSVGTGVLSAGNAIGDGGKAAGKVAADSAKAAADSAKAAADSAKAAGKAVTDTFGKLLGK